MRVAILADIHGNLPACEAVLEDVARQSPDYVVAAGDLALRGAHPAETVDLLFSRCHAVLMGNTDCYIAGNYLSGAYRERDHWKTDLLDWTRDQLGEARTRRLGELPFSVRYSPRRGQDLYVCHANPKNLEESLDPTLDELTLRKYFNNLEAAACAFGHLHFPYRRRVGRLLIADVASVGIPRDGDLRPAYGLFTFLPTGWRVQIRRVRYPVKRATQALTARKVPGGPLLIHKIVEARYRHHTALLESARRHSGLPPAPFLRPPPGLRPTAAPSAAAGGLGAADPAHDEPTASGQAHLPHPALSLRNALDAALPDEAGLRSDAPSPASSGRSFFALGGLPSPSSPGTLESANGQAHVPDTGTEAHSDAPLSADAEHDPEPEPDGRMDLDEEALSIAAEAAADVASELAEAIQEAAAADVGQPRDEVTEK